MKLDYSWHTSYLQQDSSLRPRIMEIWPYPGTMPRKPSKPRPRQGAHLLALRSRAGLTQAELAKLVGEPQPNIAFWELSDKPPRSDVLPKLAKVLGVSVDALVSPGATPIPERRRPAGGRMLQLFEDVSRLPRRQQAKVIEFVEAFVAQHSRKAS